MKPDPETSTYAQMGMAALLPGMQHMLTLMQSQLDEMRARLGILQGRQPGGTDKARAKLSRFRGVGWAA